MPNGSGLYGNASSTQSAVICPKPGTYNYGTQRYDGYYIVTIEVNDGLSAGGHNAGVRYTEVDMTLNGGLGDVVAANKNVHLFGTTTIEGANVAKHANDCDYWIIGKEVGNTNVRTYHVTPAGVNTTPVISTSNFVGSASLGSVKVSPNNKLVSIVNYPYGIEVFDFDNASGVLTHKFSDKIGSGYDYSSEFSPDSKVLYHTQLNNATIYQYDLTVPNNASFVASRTAIGSTSNTIGYQMCGLQLAPNGKIYAALQGQASLGVINSPNTLGAGCNYQDMAQSIAGVNTYSGTSMTSSLGLPAFPSFFIKEPTVIKSSYLCFNDQTKFELSDTVGVSNVDWFWTPVGSPLPIAPSANIFEPTVQLSTQGDYAVMAVVYYPCFIDSIRDTITITNVNTVNLGNDTTFCKGNTLTLDAGNGYDYYTWHDGSTNQTFLADTSGQYYVEVANVGANLVVNGDFEQGNTGFYSEHVFQNQSGSQILQGNYDVIQGGAGIYNNIADCNDHTTGTGNTFVTNGSTTTSGIKMWCTSFQVSPNTDYIFSTWLTRTSSSNPSILNFTINGQSIGTPFQASSINCEWNQFFEVWNSGLTTNVEICLINTQTQASGNSIAMDDVFFGELCKTSDTINITVGEIPHAEFSLSDTCEYTAVTFTDASSIPAPENLAHWSWDIDNDGTEDYNIQNPTHLYPAGTYTAKLTVTSANGCSKDTTMPVVTYPKPNADFTFTEKCLYDSLPFVDASTVSSPDVIAAYAWNFGENQLPAIDAQTNNPYYTYQSEGTYTVTEVVASINGCLDTVSKNINVFAVPNANFTLANVCQSDTAHFVDASTITLGNITGWNWDFGDLNYSTNQDENHHYAQDGTYTVQHIATSDNGCKDTIEQDIIIYPMPQVAFSMQNACLEQTIPFTDNSIINSPGVLNQWAWDFGDNTSPVSLQNPLHLYQNPDTYTVTLTVTSTDNCTSDFQQDVTVYPLPLVSFTASEVCENQPPTVFTNTSTIQSGSNVGFNWEFGDDNNSTSAIENPTFNYGRHGDFIVQLAVTSDMGCMDTIVDTIKVKHKPMAIFVQDTTGGCAPICVNFASQSTDSIGIQNWNWWFENGYGEGSHKYEGYCYENAGTYDVKLIVENTVGCFDTVEALGLINTFPYPIADFELTPENTTVDNAEITFTNNSTDAITWMWNFDDNTLDSVTYEPIHLYSDTGSYMIELTVYNANGCSSNVYHQVIITPIENLFIPTAFSPNGDGKNDILYVRGYINGMVFNIFDRWGKKVFESTNQSLGWDGYINNKPAMEGVYYWYLITTVDGEKKTFKGDVTLMR